jgi:hypothetical protein
VDELVVCNRARLAAERLGEEPPSYDLVHDVVSHLPTDLMTLAHQGARAYSNSFELVYRREAGQPNANLASRSYTARYRIGSIGARPDENGETVAHCTVWAAPAAARPLSPARRWFPIFGLAFLPAHPR